MSIIRDGLQSADLDAPITAPTLNLDFANSQSLDPRITFTRGSIGTRVNRNGLIETVDANQPRFDYDPVTGECKGLLIEESRSNNFLQSSRLDTSWLITVSGGSGTFIDGERVTSSVLSVDAIYDASLSTSSTFILRNSLSGQPYGTLTGLTSGATRNINSQTSIGGQNNISAFLTTETTAPDGSNNAVLCNPTTVGSQLRTITKRFITSTAATYTFSVFFKNKNITNDRVAIYIGNQTSLSNVVANFTLSTKTFSSVGQNGGWTGSVGYQDYNNDWGRIWVTATTTAGSHTFIDGSFWIGGYQGTHTSVGSLYAWGMQLEAGAFPTSYIPTTTASVTRSADVADMTGTNFSSWYNQNESTILCNFNAYNVMSSAYTGVFGIGGPEPSGLNRIQMLLNGPGGGGTTQPIYHNLYQNGPNFVDYFGFTYRTGLTKNIMRYKDGDAFVAVKDGGRVTKPASTLRALTIPLTKTMNTLSIGRVTNYLNGAISRFTYYPKALNDAEIQYLTQ